MRAITALCLLAFSIQAHDKWIVVTTIQYPTHALRKLAAMPGWQLVVVADKKTPKDWHLENCHFLSVEDQLKLPYEIVQHIPWNHYSRKNIGYLYAIEHGARIIYETDDDNVVMGDDITYLPELATTRVSTSSEPAVNVYAHFGQPGLWPRGFPLSHITAPMTRHAATQPVSIPIQQGLVNSDPDVDAIFRLTQPFQETVFVGQEPLTLRAATMCPFNSQNTVFHYQAFWGLLLPITTSFRVCDIWRGYWVQRLLWDIGSNLAFLPASAVQYRNAHNLLKDFADELDLYLKSEQLITTLLGWKTDVPTLSGRALNLMGTLIEKGFFKPQETGFLGAWIRDLERIGYVFPEVRS